MHLCLIWELTVFLFEKRPFNALARSGTYVKKFYLSKNICGVYPYNFALASIFLNTLKIVKIEPFCKPMRNIYFSLYANDFMGC